MPSIDIAANTREAERNLGKLDDKLEDVKDTLKDVAHEAGVSGDKFERTFENLQDSARDTSKAVKKVGDTGADSFKKIGSKGAEVSGELRQNLGETFSSFKGDLADLPQIAQDTLGGLAGSGALGGIAGLAATAAGAAGLGLITAAIQAQQAEAEALRERLGDAYRQAAEDGRTYLDTAALIADATDLMFNPDRAGEWKRLQEDANAIGVDNATIAAANAGDLDAQKQVQGAINEALKTANEEAKKMGPYAEYHTGQLDSIKARWDTITGVTRDQIQHVRDLQGVTAKLTEKQKADAKVVQDYFNSLIFQPTIKPKLDTSAWDSWRPSVKKGIVQSVKPNGVSWQ